MGASLAKCTLGSTDLRMVVEEDTRGVEEEDSDVDMLGNVARDRKSRKRLS